MHFVSADSFLNERQGKSKDQLHLKNLNLGAKSADPDETTKGEQLSSLIMPYTVFRPSASFGHITALKKQTFRAKQKLQQTTLFFIFIFRRK